LYLKKVEKFNLHKISITILIGSIHATCEKTSSKSIPTFHKNPLATTSMDFHFSTWIQLHFMHPLNTYCFLFSL